jgi:hypothetical protein
VSAVRKRVAEPGGRRAALVHEAHTMLAPIAEQAELVWHDLPGYRIRHDYRGRLRRQRVTIVEVRVAEPLAVVLAARRIWTRAERAHRRLSWATRLARNQCLAGPPRYAFTVFGVVLALAAFLGLSPDLPA